MSLTAFESVTPSFRKAVLQCGKQVAMQHGSGSILAPRVQRAASLVTADLGRRWDVEDGLEGTLGTEQVHGPWQLAHHQAFVPQRQVLAGQPFAFARIVIGKDRRGQLPRSIAPTISLSPGPATSGSRSIIRSISAMPPCHRSRLPSSPIAPQGEINADGTSRSCSSSQTFIVPTEAAVENRTQRGGLLRVPRPAFQMSWF